MRVLFLLIAVGWIDSLGGDVRVDVDSKNRIRGRAHALTLVAQRLARGAGWRVADTARAVGVAHIRTVVCTAVRRARARGCVAKAWESAHGHSSIPFLL